MTDASNPRRTAGRVHALPKYLIDARAPLPPNAVTAFIALLAPGASWKQIAALFDDRASAETIRDWHRGRYPAPAWALELIQQKTTLASAHHRGVIELARTTIPNRGRDWRAKEKGAR